MDITARAVVRQPFAALAASFAALLVFAWLANDVMRGQVAGFDTGIRAAIHSLASPTLTLIMKAITISGSAVILIPLGFTAVWRLAVAGRQPAAALLTISVIGGEALDQWLKLVFHRPRPAAFFGIVDPETYSFPSGHAVTAVSFYVVLALILSSPVKWKRAGEAIVALAIFWAAAIGLSRVYLGVHYPSDVIAGYSVATVWIIGLERGYALWRRRQAIAIAGRAR